MILRKRRLVWDLETDGLLPELTKIHILAIKDADTRESWVFRKNAEEDTILDGIQMLNEASMLIGHNIVGFDLEALWKIYGDEFAPTGEVRDTLVMVRMLFADEKERDYRRFHRQQLEGKYIGRHELAAWGQRLGFPKGDYSDVKKRELIEQFPHLAAKENKKELNRLVWAHWSPEMEVYAIQDVEVTYQLWLKIEAKPWPEFAVRLEHEIHALMEKVQENGFPFDVELAQILEESFRATHQKLSDKAIKHFGVWWAPGRWLKVDATESYVDPTTGVKEKDLPAYRPRAAYLEDDSRQHWGEVQIPKRTMRFKDVLKGDTEAGCPFCPVELKEFNPNSRQQIVDRLTKIHSWEPQDFTEKNNPIVDDDVLRGLIKTIPICEELAEIFYYKKRLGQLVDGEQGLIGKALERGDSKIHPRTIVGGTVTNRASHSSPNIAQVPRVVFLLLNQWKEEGVVARRSAEGLIYGIPLVDVNGNEILNRNITPLLDPDGKQFKGVPKINKETGDYVFKDDKIATNKSLMKGREGDHGWDFRNLFYVPDGWLLMGADQKGIELRALGHYMAEFDGGEYIRLVVEADPHDLHQKVMELDSRDTAKTVVYAMIYGAQDYKLGITIDPKLALQYQQAKGIGAEMRRRLMTRIPAFGSVVKSVQREARRGYVEALDGRPLYVRAQHSALNTKLQGAAATTAKLWCVCFEQFCEDDGLVHGWNGDYVILAWVHDELQIAVRDDPRIKELCRANIEAAAKASGVRLNFRAPIDIDVKWGKRWSNTH